MHHVAVGRRRRKKKLYDFMTLTACARVRENNAKQTPRAPQCNYVSFFLHTLVPNIKKKEKELR